jgi:hypothetical protein
VALRPPLDKDEFFALANQKADDWREITRISSTFLGTAAALFAAGIGRGSAWVIVLSPLPLLLGVLHMTRNARLQLQMITYLSVFSPFEETSWERDIAAVRPQFWEGAEHGWIARTVARHGGSAGEALARHITNPSLWDLWLLIAVLIGLWVDLIPALLHLSHAGCALAVGVTLMGFGAVWVVRDIARIEPERRRWTELWREYRRREAVASQPGLA